MSENIPVKKSSDTGTGLGLLAVIIGGGYLGMAVLGLGLKWYISSENSRLDREIKVVSHQLATMPTPTPVLITSATPTPTLFRQATVSGKLK